MWYGRDIGAHPTAMRFFFCGTSNGSMSAVGGPLSFLPRISWRVPCTAAWTVRRASAMGFLVSVGYIPQIMTPTVLLPAYIGSPISAGT